MCMPVCGGVVPLENRVRVDKTLHRTAADVNLTGLCYLPYLLPHYYNFRLKFKYRTPANICWLIINTCVNLHGICSTVFILAYHMFLSYILHCVCLFFS